MLRGYGRTKAMGGQKTQNAAFDIAGIKSRYWDDERDAAIKSLRKGDGLAVERLSCLATSKADLRWALEGEDKRRDYLGIFKRGNYVRDLELGVDLKDMRGVESVLRATEDWAKQARGVSAAEVGKLGGRPRKKKMAKHEAQKIWKDLNAYPTIASALKHMTGWSKSAACRPIKLGGLGPRGALPGRPQIKAQ